MKKILFAFFLSSFVFQTFGQTLKLPRIFSDHMVLQRDQPVNFWGWGAPGEMVTIKIDEFESNSKVNDQGEWQMSMAAKPAGGSHVIIINHGSESVRFEDVLFGDVWLASGQSNMEWTLNNVNNAALEVENAKYPQIRMFYVPNSIAGNPNEDLGESEWKICTPSVAENFSAIAYFFGRELHLEKNIPVGLIDATWGGTPAEAWTSVEMLHSMGDFDIKLNSIKDDPNFQLTVEKNNKLNEERYEAAFDSFDGINQGLLTRNYDDSEWETINLPDPQNSVYQITWFRKKISLSKKDIKSNLMLSLGRVNSSPIVYFNGQKIGMGEGSKYSSFDVPKSVLKNGENIIAIRVVNTWDNRVNWLGPQGDMRISSEDGKVNVPLDGTWKYNNHIEKQFPDQVIRHSHYPSVLFNGMINPIIPFTISGVIWYQGESNADRAQQYQSLFPKMIEDWRIRWGLGYFPFLFVQLANYEFRSSEPAESDWAELREAQLMTLKYPKTGMAVIIDIGEADDIHPRNKQDVGKRLYLAARKIAYGEDIVYSGPIYKKMEIHNNQIKLKFDHIGSGLNTPDNKELTGFAIAGPNKKFYWAKAEINGDDILVYSENVENPVAVRYGWDINPACNLYNKEGLPASPFRTDNW